MVARSAAHETTVRGPMELRRDPITTAPQPPAADADGHEREQNLGLQGLRRRRSDERIGGAFATGLASPETARATARTAAGKGNARSHRGSDCTRSFEQRPRCWELELADPLFAEVEMTGRTWMLVPGSSSLSMARTPSRAEEPRRVWGGHVAGVAVRRVGLLKRVALQARIMRPEAERLGNAPWASRPRLRWALRMGLIVAMTLGSLNIWTGGPLLALWIGSQFQGTGPPKMSSVAIVVVSLAVICLTLVRVLSVLSDQYNRLVGTSPTVREHAPWLRSMRGERPLYPGMRADVTALEKILVLMVVLACLAFEVWFFFFSTSPIDGRSGRSQVVPSPGLTASTATAPQNLDTREGQQFVVLIPKLP